MMAVAPWAVELRALTKRFGAVTANDRVDLRVRPGTIHGIVGENGAGKSTAMKLLYGLYRPDGGEILVQGRPRVWRSPADALAAGLGMVHQHFMLAGPLSALDNILLGAEPVRWGLIRRGAARARLAELATRYGLAVDWDAPVEQLPVGLQQRVELLKLLHREANLLILDEPTAVLTPQEAQTLFGNLRRLRDEGKTILLVTHKLKEVLAFTDRVTVMQAGRVTGDLATADTTPEHLAQLMVGRKVSLALDVPPARPRPEPALEVAHLRLGGRKGGRAPLADVSLTVRRGEIVGVAGVEGNGQTELCEAILHPREPKCRTAGSIRILGTETTDWTAARIRDLGVAVIPPDRQHSGLLEAWPIRDNFLLGLHRLAGFNRAGFLRGERLEKEAAGALEVFDVRPRDLALPAGQLSGGNQQKLILAREFARQPRLILAVQPTRGVDVGAIEFIHRRLVQARDDGAGVLLLSSELDELLTLADRIVVLYEGRLVAEFPRGQANERDLGLKMGGA